MAGEHDGYHKLLHDVSQTEFRRFFWAGSLAFAVDFGLLVVLTEVAGVNYLAAKIIVSLAVFVVNFYLKKVVLFRR